MVDLPRLASPLLRSTSNGTRRLPKRLKRFFLSGGRKLISGHVDDLLHGTRKHSFYALRNISFTVREGESLAVVGANGAGKSTLLNLATRLCPPDEGEVIVDGRLTAVLELRCGISSGSDR